MAYINAEDVKAIRNELKAKYPEFKFGVRKGSGSLSVDVTIKSGPVDFTEISSKNYGQVNQYWIDEHYPTHATFLKDVFNIIKTAPSRGEGFNKGRGWFDESDAMTDYFHTAYYIHLQIGSWDKPYIVG
jgi:hypothetical protein